MVHDSLFSKAQNVYPVFLALSQVNSVALETCSTRSLSPVPRLRPAYSPDVHSLTTIDFAFSETRSGDVAAANRVVTNPIIGGEALPVGTCIRSPHSRTWKNAITASLGLMHNNVPYRALNEQGRVMCTTAARPPQSTRKITPKGECRVDNLKRFDLAGTLTETFYNGSVPGKKVQSGGRVRHLESLPKQFSISIKLDKHGFLGNASPLKRAAKDISKSRPAPASKGPCPATAPIAGTPRR